MALMTEERRKEMEEEMSRFELEIAAPGGGIQPASNSHDMLLGNKPLSPPPPPPAVAVLIPEVLAKAPPPPPSSPPPLHAVLRPPPPPPSVIQARPQTGPIRFIPHQLHRHPPRPPMRHSFIPVRGVPIPGPPGHFPPPGPVGPFVPPIAQPPPMGGPQIPSSPMPPMGPGPMPMPGPMPGPLGGMPPQMGNINVSLPMPPGFCPPGTTMAPGTSIPCEAQPFMPSDTTQNFDTSVSVSSSTLSSSESATVVAAAPAIYAAPFVKSHAETGSDGLQPANGQESIVVSAGLPTSSKTEKQSSKTVDEYSVGPTVPSVSTNEETVVSKKKEKKKKIVRMAGGQAWEDNSLLEWETDDFRIFCGDLGNDVTDEVLIRAFSKYPSFVKAKVIRDKRTNKTKGYGFVSFKDPQDFIKAMREMNGKYVGSRPIKLRKSTWRDRNIDIVKKKQREKEKLGLL